MLVITYDPIRVAPGSLPPDEARVQIFVPRQNEKFGYWMYAMFYAGKNGRPDYWEPDDDLLSHVTLKPTHWMPSPPKPE